jgi:hypothetical protein
MQHTIENLVELLGVRGEKLPSEILDGFHEEQHKFINKIADLSPQTHVPEFDKNTSPHPPGNVNGFKNSPITENTGDLTNMALESNVSARLCELDLTTIGMEFVLR